MKKIYKILVLFGSILMSCSNGNSSSSIVETGENPVISSHAYNETSISVSLADIESKILLKENFILYISSSSCMGCEEFTPIVNSFVKNNKVDILKVDIDNVDFPSNNEHIPYQYTPTIAIVQNGEVKKKVDQVNNSSIFVSYDNFSNFILDNIVISTFRLLNNENELDKLISEDSEKYIYFYWQSCGDCSFFKRVFFDEYLKENKIICYGFEMSYYFQNRIDNDIWDNFVNKYYLSKSSSEEFGYKNGVVPTLQKRKGDILTASRVIFNDENEKEYNDNAEVLSVTITGSYYEDNPYIGKKYSRTDKYTAMEMYRMDTKDYFIKKVREII